MAGPGITSLSNHLLIAMPQLADPNFSQTVSLICEHGDKGALGIVLNRPLSMTLSEVFEQMRIEPTDRRAANLPVLRGGPVHQDRGFVLHRPGGEWDSTHKISESIQVTTSRDVLAAMATGTGPEKAFIALGYAGWEAGQLEKEMLDNSWLSVPADESVIFDLPYEERWLASLRLLGVEAGQLTSFSGHACRQARGRPLRRLRAQAYWRRQRRHADPHRASADHPRERPARPGLAGA